MQLEAFYFLLYNTGMISLDYGVLEELERHLAPLLEAAGFPVESLQAIGMLDRRG